MSSRGDWTAERKRWKPRHRNIFNIMIQEEPWRKPRQKVDHYESPGVRKRAAYKRHPRKLPPMPQPQPELTCSVNRSITPQPQHCQAREQDDPMRIVYFSDDEDE